MVTGMGYFRIKPNREGWEHVTSMGIKKIACGIFPNGLIKK